MLLFKSDFRMYPLNLFRINYTKTLIKLVCIFSKIIIVELILLFYNTRNYNFSNLFRFRNHKTSSQKVWFLFGILCFYYDHTCTQVNVIISSSLYIMKNIINFHVQLTCRAYKDTVRTGYHIR